jgi:hypothetical protein
MIYLKVFGDIFEWLVELRRIMWTGVVECVEFIFFDFSFEFSRQALIPAMAVVSIPPPSSTSLGITFTRRIVAWFTFFPHDWSDEGKLLRSAQ